MRRHYRQVEAVLAAQAAVALLGAVLQVRFRSIEAMNRWALPRQRGNRRVDELLLAFRRAADRLGGTCLVRALALRRFLALHGHATELRIGVASGPIGLRAHAWLLEGERILIGDGDEAATFTVLTTWFGREA